MPIIYFLLLLLPFLSFSQDSLKPKERIIYKVSSLTSNTVDGYGKLVILEHRIPTIERILQTLSKANNPNQKLFKEVSSLNHFFDEKNHAIFIQNIFRGDTLRDITYKKKDIESVLNSIYYFLEIRIVLQGNNAIYNFYLYEVKEDSLGKKLLTYNASSDANIIINSPDSEQINNLTRALKILFKEANNKPEAEIKVKGKELDKDSVVYFAEGDTICLIGNIVDNDLREGFIQYNWYVQPIGDNGNKNFLNLKPNEKEQKIVLKEGDNFKVSLKVYDGIDYCQMDASIYVYTVYKPRIAIEIDSSFDGNFQTERTLYYTHHKKFLGKTFSESFYYDKPVSIDFKINDTENNLSDTTSHVLEIISQKERSSHGITLINELYLEDLNNFSYTDSFQFYYRIHNGYCNLLIYPPAKIKAPGAYKFNARIKNSYAESNNIQFNIRLKKLDLTHIGCKFRLQFHSALVNNELIYFDEFVASAFVGFNFYLSKKIIAGASFVGDFPITDVRLIARSNSIGFSLSSFLLFRAGQIKESACFYVKIPIEMSIGSFLVDNEQLAIGSLNLGFALGFGTMTFKSNPIVFVFVNASLMRFQERESLYVPNFARGISFGLSAVFNFVKTETKTNFLNKKSRDPKRKILYIKFID